MFRDSNDVYEYKGYYYNPWKEYEEDNVKIFHDVSIDTTEGVRIASKSLPLSPYYHAGFTLFKNWIDMGQPSREQLGGHHREDHERYYQKWVSEQLEKELDL